MCDKQQMFQSKKPKSTTLNGVYYVKKKKKDISYETIFHLIHTQSMYNRKRLIYTFYVCMSCH